ncbi:MAG: alpha-1,2-fucosyltransferase [Prevotella sp.]|nr:alpha-1,2-fucosyltransferase [Prevotella sp.]
MKIVVHIESGLGNQMLSYCELLAMRQMNPDADCYVETMVYDIPECNDVICQWNGFELADIFHIDAPNVRELFDESRWQQLLGEVRKSAFWLKNWNYPVYFTQAFSHVGLPLQNFCGDFEAPGELRKTTVGLAKYRQSKAYLYIRYLKRKLLNQQPAVREDYASELFQHVERDVFAGQKLLFKYRNSGIERLESEIRSAFVFPAIDDERNAALMEEIGQTNSVAIHARRGDMLSYNFDCYAGGYFKRSIRYIRQHVSNPVFYIFCDSDSIEWARRNSRIFGLNFKKDTVRFVDWNTGRNSWRDMQLMAACKHQVVTRSSFGWWAAWLNTNPEKITCSPDLRINTTHHF